MHPDVNLTRSPYDLSRLANDRAYRRHVRALRGRGRDLRRRAFIAALTRARNAGRVERMTGVEVGCNFGAMAEYLLAECPFIARLTLVDPWATFSDDHPDRDHHGYARRTIDGWRRVMNIALDRLPQFGGRAVVVRTTGAEAGRAFAGVGERVWFAYLDGSHRYEDVLADLRAWWPNIVPGGMACGDDYLPPARRKGDQRDDVSKAVDAFAAEVGRPVIPLHRNFFIAKPLDYK